MDIQKWLSDFRKEMQDKLDNLAVGARQIRANSLSDISKTLGLILSGEFRSGNGIDPGKGFSGVRMGYPPFEYLNTLWNLVGVSNDALQFGLSSTDGKAYFGGGSGTIDKFGVHVYTSTGKPSLIALSAAETINGESLGEGDVLLGDNSSTKPNILWDASAGYMYFRSGTVPNGYLSSSGLTQVASKVEMSNQSIATGTGIHKTIHHSVERYDDANFCNLATEDNGFIIPAGMGGTYTIGLNYAFDDPGAGNYWRVRLRINNTTTIATCTIPYAYGSFVTGNIVEDYVLAPGDNVYASCLHTNAGSLNVQNGGLYIRKIR